MLALYSRKGPRRIKRTDLARPGRRATRRSSRRRDAVASMGTASATGEPKSRRWTERSHEYRQLRMGALPSTSNVSSRVSRRGNSMVFMSHFASRSPADQADLRIVRAIHRFTGGLLFLFSFKYLMESQLCPLAPSVMHVCSLKLIGQALRLLSTTLPSPFSSVMRQTIPSFLSVRSS
jgi:hypothetical protein